MCQGSVDMGYGPPTDHPLDPRNDEEGLTSLQPLGLAKVMVEFNIDPSGAVQIVGAYIEGELVDADEFSEWRIGKWEKDIAMEIDHDRL